MHPPGILGAFPLTFLRSGTSGGMQAAAKPWNRHTPIYKDIVVVTISCQTARASRHHYNTSWSLGKGNEKIRPATVDARIHARRYQRQDSRRMPRKGSRTSQDSPFGFTAHLCLLQRLHDVPDPRQSRQDHACLGRGCYLCSYF